MKYRFGNFVLDTATLELRHGPEHCKIEPQVFHVLEYLVRHSDRVVSKSELIEAVWNGRAISDSALNSRINLLRRAVGDNGKEQAVIRTVQKLGFRFVAEVEKFADENPIEQKVGSDTETPGSGPRSEKPSIAVLPFNNMSEDPAQEYFSDGLAEDLITELSKFHSLLVIARNSSFIYKGHSVDVKQVVQDLAVRYVVEGSVRKVGQQVRVTAQLIDGISGAHIWADRYDRNLDDIFVVQDEITHAISTAIGVEYTGAEYVRANKVAREGLGAWDLAMRAGWFHNEMNEDGNAEAQRLLKEAISLDPGEAHFHALIASTYIVDAIHGWARPSTKSSTLALASARRAVARDRKDATALCYLGAAQTFARQPEDAIVSLKQSIECNPNLATAFGHLSYAYGHCGDYDACLETMYKAIRLSPRDRRLHLWKAGAGVTAFACERYDEAVAFGCEVRRDRPDFMGGHRLLAACYGHLGEVEKAREAVRDLLTLIPEMTAKKASAQVPYKDPAVLQRYVNGLIKAGLPKE